VTIVVGDAAVFADWKTGKRREDPWELEIQAMMLRKKHPEIARCTGYYVWLKDVELGDPHQLNKDNSVQARIQGMMNHVARAEQLNHWPKRENPLCGWCDVKTCEFNRSGK
jgi:predicted RNA-binding protein with TRAM domain